MTRSVLCLLALAVTSCTPESVDKADDPDDTGDPIADDGGDDTGDEGDDTGLPDDTGTETDPDATDDDGDGYSEDDGDCDDTDAAISPDAVEVCDGVDNDCDGVSDADSDRDGDGVSDCADTCPLLVDAAAGPGGTGGHDAPLQLIQDAIDATATAGCSEVEVAPGTYVEQLDTLGYAVHVFSTDGPESTIVDGNGAGSVLTITTGEGRDTIVEGLTLTGGDAATGGGVDIAYAAPTLRDLVIDGNTATNGAGVHSFEADPLVEDCVFRGNDACYGGSEEGCDGGGLKARYGAPEIVGNVFEDNTAGDGGALWLAWADALVVHNVITGNRVHDSDPVLAGQGGGVNVQVGTTDLLIVNNLITDNTASTHGGGVNHYRYRESAGNPTIAHNVIAWNTVSNTTNGGGFLAFETTGAALTGNLVYANDGPGITTNGQVDVTYNLVASNTTDWSGSQGDLTGSAGNLSAAPVVTQATDNGDWTDDDWTPGTGSPLIDAADPATTDPDGSRADIGAFGGSRGSW